MDFISLINYFQNNKEQLNLNVQGCIPSMEANSSLTTGKQISITYQVLKAITKNVTTNISETTLSKQEYMAALKCIEFILNNWTKFCETVKQNQIGTIIYRLLKYSSVSENAVMYDTLFIYLKYSVLDNLLDKNILKWVLKQPFCATLPDSFKCGCKGCVSSNCTLLDLSKQKLIGILLHTAIYEKAPFNFIKHLNSHLYKLSTLNISCCHLLQLSTVIKDITPDLLNLMIMEETVKLYFFNSINLLSNSLKLCTKCKQCTHINEMETLKDMQKSFDGILKCMGILEEKIVIRSHCINAQLLILKYCVQLKSVTQTSEKFSEFLKLMTNFMVCFPTDDNFAKYNMKYEYCTHIINNILSLTVDGFNVHSNNKNILNCIKQLCCVLINTVINNKHCDKVMQQNIRKIVQLLYGVSLTCNIDSVIMVSIEKLILYACGKYNISELIDIRCTIIVKVIEKSDSIRVSSFFSSKLWNCLPFPSVVNAIASEVTFYNKSNHKPSNKIFVPKDIFSNLSSNDIPTLLKLAVLIYSKSSYFETFSVITLCEYVIKKNSNEFEMKMHWEILIQAKLILFLIKWQNAIHNDWKNSLQTSCSKVNEEICNLSFIKDIVKILKQFSKQKWIYNEKTLKALLIAGSLLNLHGDLISSAYVFTTICELLSQEKIQKCGIYYSMLSATKATAVYHQLHFPMLAKKYADLAQLKWKEYTKTCSDNTIGLNSSQYLQIQSMVKISKCQSLLSTEKHFECFLTVKDLYNDVKDEGEESISDWINVQVNIINAELYPHLYEKENVDFKILPLKNSLTALFNLNKNDSKNYLQPIISSTFTNNDSTFVDTENPIFFYPTGNLEEESCLCADFIGDLVNTLYDISYFYVSVGDLTQVMKYLPLGLHVTKKLKLYVMEVKFIMLIIRVKSRTNENVTNNLYSAAEVIKIIELSYHSEDCQIIRMYSNSIKLEFSRKKNINDIENCTQEFKINPQRNGKSEITNNDIDDIQIHTVPIEEPEDLIEKDNNMSSPLLKRKNRNHKIQTMEILEHEKKCLCLYCSDYTLFVVQIQFTCLAALFYFENEHTESGISLCKEILQILKNFFKENFPSFCKQDAVTGLNFYKAEVLLTWFQGNLILKNFYYCGELLKELMQALDDIHNCSTNEIFSKLNVLLNIASNSCFINSYKVLPVDCDMVIDSITGYVTSEHSDKSGTGETTGKLVEEKQNSSVKQSIKKMNRKTIGTPAKNTAKTFDIFNDAPETVSLMPKPNLEESDDDIVTGIKSISLKTPQLPVKTKSRKKTCAITDSLQNGDVSFKHRKSPPNIMITRQTASKRHRLRNGPVYTDQSPERTRGRRKHTPLSEMNSLTDSKTENENIKSTTNNSTINFTLKEQKESLTKALRGAVKTHDSITCKESLHLLSDLHYRCYHNIPNNYPKEEIIAAASYHLMSVGVSYRILSHYYMKQALKTNNREKSYRSWLQDGIKITHPKQILSSFNNTTDYYNSTINFIPTNWTVCSISLFKTLGESYLILTRVRKNTVPLHIQLQDKVTASFYSKFNEILQNNAMSMKNIKDKSRWWTERRDYNRDIKSILLGLEAESLSFMKGMLLGKLQDTEQQLKLDKESITIAQMLKLDETNEITIEQIKLFLDSWSKLNASEKAQALKFLSCTKTTNQDLSKTCVYIENKFNDEMLTKRHHVILVLDKIIQSLPWENIPILYTHPVTRMPSYDNLILQLKLMSNLNDSVGAKGVNMNTVAYVLNPAKDLMATEKRFRDWFSSAESWKGIVSRPPTEQEWIDCITKYDLFIYTGHGSGSRYVHSNTISKLQGRAASFIMGCSSGALDEYGNFEPTGPVLSYLMSGIPCVLSCLWSVTDKDIDRFLAKLLTVWAGSTKHKGNLAECMHAAKSSCTMRWLNGSACVIYGLPVECQVKLTKLLDFFPANLNV